MNQNLGKLTGQILALTEVWEDAFLEFAPGECIPLIQRGICSKARAFVKEAGYANDGEFIAELRERMGDTHRAHEIISCVEGALEEPPRARSNFRG